MIGASKILTVSYGTFSCTLEGFDEPFGTMKAIAEYFRDLAADDRYFGAEPATPDAAMLNRIAEREIHRRVEARVEDNAVILRATSASEQGSLPAPAASLRPMATQPVPGTEPVESVAVKLMRIRAAALAGSAVGQTVMPDSPATAGPMVSSEMLAADDGRAFSDFGRGHADLPEAFDAVAEHQTADGSDGRDAAEFADDADAEIVVVEPTGETATVVVDLAAVDDRPADDLGRLAEAAPDTAAATAEPGPDDDGDRFDAPMAFDGSADDDWYADEPVSAPAPSATAADSWDEGDDDLPDAAVAPDVGEAKALLPALDDLDAADDLDADDLDTDDDRAPHAAKVQPQAVAVPEPAPAPPAPVRFSAALEKIQRARARIINIKRTGSPDSVAARTPQPAGLTPEAAAELARAMAADQPAEEPVAEPVIPSRPTRRPAMIDDEEPAVDASVNRLLAQTATEMDVPEQRRRRSAIEHLKAAVAATVADRRVGGALPPSEEERADPYRSDLSQMVAPPRPVPLTERPTPLVLVSEQRIDRAPLQDDAGSRGLVRPRRVGGSAVALRSVEPDDETDADDDGFDAGEPIDPQGFAAFAERLGARDLPDLLEAAAAFTAVIEGRPHFSRPHLMRQVGAVVDDEDFTRETGLRSFGTLLRTGRVVRVKRGQYALSEASRFMAEARAL